MSEQPELPDIEDIYELSPMQMGMLFQSLLAPGSGVFVEQLASRIPGGLDAGAFQRAWQAVVDRTPVLRTSFHWGDMEKPIQVVHRHVAVPIELVDWRRTPEREQSSRLTRYLATLSRQGFDFDAPPLLRIALIRVAETDAWFVWTFHHLLLDGWSSQLLLRELVDQYQALRLGKPYEPPARRPFSDYIGWLQEQDQPRTEAFWRGVLAGFTAPTPIGIGKPPATDDPEANDGEHLLTLPAAASEAMRAFARQNRLTLNTLIQGAWALLLSRYSGEPDVLYGSVVSGRPADLPGIETMIGLFINTLPVRVRVPAEALLVPWLEEIQRRQVEAEQYQCVSTLQLQQWSGLPAGTKLFDTVLIFENFPTAFRSEDDGGGTLEDSVDLGRTDMAIAVVVMPGERVGLKVVFDRRRFEPAAIERLAGDLAALLRQIPASREATLGTLSLLSAEERHRMLREWNATGMPGYDALPLMAILAEQAERTPGAPAFYGHGGPVSFRAIDERSNRLAHHLIAGGVGPGSVVGVCLERSIEAVVAFLAILKVRGVYLPLDRSYPPERLAFMLEDSAAVVTIVTGGELPPVPSSRAIDLSAVEEGGERHGSLCPAPHAAPGDLAYVLYTSGSTGRPKGVAVEHRVILNRLAWMWREYPFEPGEVGVLRTPLNFVDTFWEMLGGLLRGVPAVIAPETVARDPDGFIDLLARHGVTRMWLVPSYLEMLLAASPRLGVRLPRLRQWWSGGEPLSLDLYRRFRKAAPAAVLYNVYGASEIWDGTVFDPAVEGGPDLDDEKSGQVPIGRPIANTEAYILDRDRQPVPVGVAGELHFGGACLARGYLNQDALTRERFQPHPFSDRPGARLYATGDLARFRADGAIEYVGRRDTQINLRGFRIEPAEVEAAIEAHPRVRESIVAARETASGDHQLTAYVVAAGGPIDTPALLAHVRRRLPAHMIPGAVFWLDALPKTPSGKRDRANLPAAGQPGPSGQSATAGPAAPTTPLERRLAARFEEVLGVSPVGRDDHFFSDLGGHSLLATRLMSRLREELGIALPLRTIFDAPTVARLAAELAPRVGDADTAATEMAEAAAAVPAGLDALSRIPRLSRERPAFPLSFAQERLWFLDQLTPGNPFYSLSSVQRLPFAVDLAALERALTGLARRHEVLRTVFPVVDGDPVQQILAPEPWRCAVFDVAAQPPAQREAEIRRLTAEAAQEPFDLAAGPLFRSTLIRSGPSESLFVFVIHHILADSWSLEILFRELAVLYADARAGRTSSLPEPPIQYVDFAVWQREWLQGEELERQLDYWRRQLSALPTLSLATDRPRPRAQSFRGAQLGVEIPAALVQAVHALAREADVTPFMVLLTVFFVLLHGYTGQDDLVLGTPIANRNRVELEGVVGFFANSLVLRADLSGDPAFRKALERARGMALEAYSHQDVAFSKLVAELRPEQDLSRNPLFQVSFQLISAASGARSGSGEGDRRLTPERGASIFDLVLNLWEDGPQVRGLLEFNTDLFERTTMERLAGHYTRLLAAALAAPDSRLGALPLLGEPERQQLLVEWNATGSALPDVCLHALFEEQAERTPRAVAVRSGEEEITYQELARAAERLAGRLQDLGVGPRQCVGVLLPPGLDLVVSLLAVLKTGNAYVPLDASSPGLRVASMIQDAGLEWVLTRCEPGPELARTGARALRVDSLRAEEAGGARFAPAGVTPADLAYVIFTSGSTGRPKGVMIAHRSAVSYLDWCRRIYPVDAGSGAPLCSPVTSDMSVTSLFLPLAAGGCVTLLAEGDVVESLDTALRDGPPFSFVKLTPSHLQALRDLAIGRGAPAGTAAFVVGGEALAGETLDLWRGAAPGLAIYNEYGPTEATVGCCVQAARAGDLEPGPVPIGRPIANTRLYVLNRYGAPVPVGVPGELYIGGAGLALGYLHEPGLTAERFVPDPFSGPSQRLYRTGDRVRYRVDGTLEFLGRLDGQIKIRGYRIEPGEVEAAIRLHPRVAGAVVLCRDLSRHDRRLVACVVPAQAPETPAAAVTAELADDLRGFLRQRLPSYMVPGSFLFMAAIPLTKNGKVDVRGIEASSSEREPRGAPVPPRTPLEEILARVFADVLKVRALGVHDDFFAHLGGHSLLATKATARIRELLQVKMPLRALFEAPTVEGLARSLLTDPQTGSRLEQAAELLVQVLRMSDEQVTAHLDSERIAPCT